MRLFLGILLSVCGVQEALACSCGRSQPFFSMAAAADLVVLGRILDHEAHGVDVAIEDVYRGSDERAVVRVWGDDGGSCRPAASSFSVGSQWVLVLTPARSSTDGNRSSEAYAVEGCGVVSLRVTDGTVYLSDQQSRLPLSRLATEIARLDPYPPPPAPAREQYLARLAGIETTPAPPAICAFSLHAGIPGTLVNLVEPIAAGHFKPAIDDAELLARYLALPHLCRVTGSFLPSRETIVPFELWIPSAWSGASAGGVIVETDTSGGTSLIETVNPALLDRGVAVFGLTVPDTVDLGDPVGRFRGIVARMYEEVTLIGSRAFLGSTGVFGAAAFSNRETMSVVPRGPGAIEGSVTRNGAPIAGLELRLLLNAKYYSPWVTTDAAGRYRFELPYGKYSIDGYQLDPRSADRVLAGAVDPWRRTSRIAELTVSDSGPAPGLDLSYLDPVVVRRPVGNVTGEQARRIVWDPYPGAASYTVQLRRDSSEDTVYVEAQSWNADGIETTAIEIAPSELELVPGRWHLRVMAEDADGDWIVGQPSLEGHAFRVTE